MNYIGDTILVVILGAIVADSFSLVGLQFKHHGISPNFVKLAPKEMFRVSFPTVNINLGTKVLAAEVTDHPKIIWSCHPKAYYTLIMFDCDPLGRHSRLLSEMRHWVVGNIRSCDVSNGETIIDYLPPSPIIDTGHHRYVFLMYQHIRPINFEEPFIRRTEIEGRPYTSMNKFALKYDLGYPIAGNFLLCEYDSRSNETLTEIEYYPEYVDRAISQSIFERNTKRRPVLRHVG